MLNSRVLAAGNPMRFLVTGGAGFIGHRTVSNLLASSPGAAVAIVDDLSVGMPMPEASGRLFTYQVDIRNRDAVKVVIADFKPDTIINLAAVHHIPTCERQRSYALEVNIVGTENMLSLAEEAGVRRFVQASSGAVYGWYDGALLEDESALDPADNYALSKSCNEKQVTFWARRTNSFARIARIFNTIGHDDPNAHLIPDILSQVDRSAKTVEIALGNVTPRRDYIHADDTARAIAAMAQEVSDKALDVYNVSTGVDVSVRELVGMLGAIIDIDIVIREDPDKVRRVDRPTQLGSTTKISAALGFAPQKSLKIALEDIARHTWA